MNGLMDSDSSEFVEVDPTGRYGRYNEILGKGASKIVYRAFDEYEGIEVAWNQVKLYDFLQSPEDLERLYCEIHLLKTLKHKNIMKFYCSWVDTANRNINFVTEMFTSGTLRQYRLKHKRVNIRAVKHWCRQILRGLLYLHSHDPPVIHRDLKCDNIFVNGNQGEVKIGDLGLAAILRKSHAAHCVGTPEFMAPEVYEEEYNELVDIYSFGMCILEMITFEYPYSECNHPAQIYKKVISGKKPDSFYEVKDPEVRQFVEKCLASVSHRLPARELLDDPFLRLDNYSSDSKVLDHGGVYESMGSLIRQPYVDFKDNTYSSSNEYSNGYDYERHNELDYHLLDVEPSGIELFEHHDDEYSLNVEISIKGKIKDDGSIFLRLRIADKEGRIRNIYFPFDIENDTALSVATEMVAELDIMDQDVTKIADMIDGEMASLVPEWRPGPGIVETPRGPNLSLCQNCASTCTSTGSLMEFLSENPCCVHGCASMHGRFEEITFQVDQSENHLTAVVPNITGESDHGHYDENWGQHESCELTPEGSGITGESDHGHCDENWGQHESRELTPEGSGRSHSDEEYEKFDTSASEQDETEIKIENGVASIERNPVVGLPPLLGEALHSQEDKVQQKLRWLKAKYRMELRTIQDQQVGVTAGSPTSSGNRAQGVTNWVLSPSQRSLLLREADDERLLKPSASGKRRIPGLHVHVNKNCCPDSGAQSVRRCEVKNYYTGSLARNSLHRRTTSLPVDAVDL